MLTIVDQLPRLGKRELICLLLFACNYVVFVWRGFLWVLGMGYVILLWHSLSLPYNYFYGVDIVKPSNNNSIVACFISWIQTKLLMKLLDTLLQMSERQFRFWW